MKKTLFIILVSFVFSGCTNEDQAARVLRAEGVTNVQFTGYRFLICGGDYTFQTGFTGIKNGQAMSGAVCSGIMKGAQVKYD